MASSALSPISEDYEYAVRSKHRVAKEAREGKGVLGGVVSDLTIWCKVYL
jgi:hypothetical protein